MQQPKERHTFRQAYGLVFDDIRFEAIEPDWRATARRLQARRWRLMQQATRGEQRLQLITQGGIL